MDGTRHYGGDFTAGILKRGAEDTRDFMVADDPFGN